MTVIDVLTRARALIARPRGWCQGNYSIPLSAITGEASDRGMTAYCMAGAIDHCRDDISQAHELTRTVRRAIGLTSTTIVGWNDDPARTQQDVIDAFDRAIALARDAEVDRG